MASICSLENKVAFVTGSTRGIGWAIAQIFAQQGATVLLNGRSDKTVLDGRVDELKKAYGAKAEGFLFDVGDYSSVKACYAEIFKKYRQLDVLVNNAGLLQGQLIGMTTPDVVDALHRTNLNALYYNTQYASKLMARNKAGSIINLSSIVGAQGSEGYTVYGATKAAVAGYTKSASKELAPMGIRVNAISPGVIETDLIQGFTDAQRESLEAAVRLGRLGRAEDVARVALFFASDLSAYITGQVLGVDGGLTL